MHHSDGEVFQVEAMGGVSDHCPAWAEFFILYDDDPS